MLSFFKWALKVIGYIAGAIIIYLILIFTWRIPYLVYQAVVNGRQYNDEDVERGSDVWSVGIMNIFIGIWVLLIIAIACGMNEQATPVLWDAALHIMLGVVVVYGWYTIICIVLAGILTGIFGWEI